MRILQILLSERTGGAESIAATLDDEWGSLGLTTSIAYVDLPDRRRGRTERVRTLRREIRSFRPDVIVAHTATPAQYARLVAPLRLPIYVVLHSASDDYAWTPRRLLERVLLRRTSGVVAVSRGQEAVFQRHFPAFGAVCTIYPGLAAQVPAPRIVRETPNLAVTVSRVASQKNPQLWLEVAADCLASAPELRFEWWGPVSPDEPELNRLLARDSGFSNCAFMGPTSEVPTVLSGADFMFHPSDREAPGISLMEAAAHGIPVICSSEAARFLPPEISPITFAAGDRVSALRAFEVLRSDWATIALSALRNAGQVGSKYSAPRMAEQYLAFMEVNH